MLTYLIIGVIVQACILIERAIRLPELLDFTGREGWKFWVAYIATVIVGCAFNVLIWPVTIVAEIYNIYKHQ